MGEFKIAFPPPEDVDRGGADRKDHRDIFFPVGAPLQNPLANLNRVHEAADDDDACAHDHHRHHHRDRQQVHQRGSGYDNGSAYPGWNDIENLPRYPHARPRHHSIRLELVPPEGENDRETDETPPDRAIDQKLNLFHPGETEFGVACEVLYSDPCNDVKHEIPDT